MNLISSPMNGHKFVIVDGIDGAGKSTVLGAARTWLEARPLVVFDASEFQKANHRLPTVQDLPPNTAAILTAEPTHCGIGRAIRDIVIAKGSPYTAWQTAQAFALDRDTLYRTLLMPFLESRTGQEAWVIHDRGIVSSLAYQPLQSQRNGDTDPVTVKKMLALPGNQTALACAPTDFIFLDVGSDIAQRRLQARSDKQDNDIFDDTGFQAALAERYLSDEVLAPFIRANFHLTILDGSKSQPEVALAMQGALDRIAS